MVVLGRLGRAAEVALTRPTEEGWQGPAGAIPDGLWAGSRAQRHRPAAEGCRAQAFEVIGSLIKLGWKDRAALEIDPDLDAVREDPKFTELLKQIPKP